MKRFIVAGLAAVLVIFAGIVIADPGMGPGPGNCKGCGMGPGMGGHNRMYDPAKVEIITGQEVSLEHAASPRGMGMRVGFKLNTGSETIVVHLGPQWFIDEQGVKIAAGDTVEIKGAKAERWGEKIFIAAEVKKGAEVLKLRDENGVPAWAGWRRSETKQGV
jgi:hypothetical protein